MLDNLRRSSLAPLTLLAFGLSWLLPMPAAAIGTLLILATMAIPAYLPILFSLLPRRAGIRLRSHLATLAREVRLASAQMLVSLASLPDQAWQACDAALRTLVRLFVTHRHLLEWTTAAKSSESPRLGVVGFYRQMAGGTVLALVMTLGALALAPSSWPVVLPFALLWLTAPILARWASRSPTVAQHFALSDSDAGDLRLTARRTWRFFETFVTPAENMLPPDNFPGRAEAGHRASDLADQYRPVPALGGGGPRLRLGRHDADGGAARSDLRDAEEAAALQGAFRSAWCSTQICSPRTPRRERSGSHSRGTGGSLRRALPRRKYNERRFN